MFPGSKTSTVEDIIVFIGELQDDATVPKNVKEKIASVVGALKDEKNEMNMRVDKALEILDDVAEDSNLQSYTRTQVWNIVSMLEKL